MPPFHVKRFIGPVISAVSFAPKTVQGISDLRHMRAGIALEGLNHLLVNAAPSGKWPAPGTAPVGPGPGTISHSRRGW